MIILWSSLKRRLLPVDLRGDDGDMRPVEIAFQAFGPYEGEERVDFEKFGSDGLFLICGETGSGKTMLLDAMMFALYGKSSGHGRDDFASMRCTRADGDTDTYVKFTFESKGVMYVFERRLVQKRKNISASYSMKKKLPGSDYEVMSENPRERDLNDMAKEIIGLDYEQFRQVIVLPQGQFEKLLTSNSDEKEKILTDIFGERKWADIAERFYENADRLYSELKGKKENISARLKEEGCDDISELRKKAGEQKEKLNRIEAEFRGSEYTAEKEALQESLTLVKRFEELDKVRKEKELLDDRKNERDEDEKKLKEAERAEKVREHLSAAERAEKEYRKRQRELEKASEDEKTAEERMSLTRDALKEHMASEERYEELRLRRSMYEARFFDYSEFDRLSGELAEKRALYEAASEKRADRKAVYERYTFSIMSITAELTGIRAENSRLFSAYISSVCGSLAAELEDGKPCPVCGSTEHPGKAAVSVDGVSKEYVDSKKEEEDAKYRELEECTAKQKEAKADYEKAVGDMNRAESDLRSVEGALRSVRAKLIDGIDSEEELSRAVRDISSEMEDFEVKRDSLLKKEREADEALAGARAAAEEKMKDLSDAEAENSLSRRKLDTAVRENGFSSDDEVRKYILSKDEYADIQKKVVRFDIDRRNNSEKLGLLTSELEGMDAPDKGYCLSRIKEIDRIEQEHSAAKATAENELSRLEGKLTSIEADGEGLEDALRQAEADLAFAKKLRGNTGMSLQRYVLGIMFSSVVSAANRMLELVHGGRYRLFRTDERVRGSNKRGLELKVYDRYSAFGEGRFVNTLSGGEKFLVSLSLSIGLSTVAQKSGMSIEALFIDEGFGSLDEDSIADAMEILDTVRETNGLVGIISHVQLLSERIPAKLVVTKKDGVSHITQSFG